LREVGFVVLFGICGKTLWGGGLAVAGDWLTCGWIVDSGSCETEQMFVAVVPFGIKTGSAKLATRVKPNNIMPAIPFEFSSSN
jgi:hypothetical protein